MSHAAIGRSKDTHPSSTRLASGQEHRWPEQMRDADLASAVAQAVRLVPGVVDLSAGLIATVATYGPGQRVDGIIVHHPNVDEVIIEVHVVLSESHCKLAARRATAGPAERGSDTHGPVTEIASQVRSVVRTTVQNMTSLTLVRADVFVDDLQ